MKHISINKDNFISADGFSKVYHVNLYDVYIDGRIAPIGIYTTKSEADNIAAALVAGGHEVRRFTRQSLKVKE